MSTIASANEKPLEWPNLTAPIDLRSNPDAVQWGRWRFAENVRSTEKGQLIRREGWRSFGYQTGHPNSDLHAHTAGSPVRSLYVHPGRGGKAGSRLFAGTTSDVWMNRADGGWSNMLDGQSGGKWSFASVGSILVACNGKTAVWTRVGGPDRMAPIPSLADIDVSAASVCWEFQGTVFLADVVMGGVRVRNRVVWAGQNSIEFVPTADNTASFFEVNPCEQILVGVMVGTTFMVFTTHGHWRLGVQDGAFVWQNVYYSKERVGCLIDPAAIAVNRGVAFIVASDGIYTVTPFSAAPEWTEWINDGLPDGFVPQNSTCAIEAAVFDPLRSEVWFSCPSAGQTFVIDTRHGSSSVIDKAWTALVAADLFRSDDVAMWWVRSGICTPERVIAFFGSHELDDDRVWPDAEGTATGCTPFDPPCSECSSSYELVGASADDRCLKFIDPDYFSRDMRVAGSVVAQAYGSRLVTGSLNFGTQEWKRFTRTIVEFIAAQTDLPGKLSLRVGVSASAVDPLSQGCRRVWVFSQKTMACAAVSEMDHPNGQPADWTFVVEGRYVFFDIRVESVIGAPVTFTRFSVGASRSPNSTP